MEAFVPSSPSLSNRILLSLHARGSMGSGNDETIPSSLQSMRMTNSPNVARRDVLQSTSLAAAAVLMGAFPSMAVAEENIFAPKFVQEYPDFVQSDEGWSYKDVKVGSGESPKEGDRVVYEWSGYTIGYFGRPFEAKGYVREV